MGGARGKVCAAKLRVVTRLGSALGRDLCQATQRVAGGVIEAKTGEAWIGNLSRERQGTRRTILKSVRKTMLYRIGSVAKSTA